MGEILTASCDCGFHKQILAGQGSHDTGEYPLPALCEECRELMVADFNKPECPLCGRRPIFYGEMDHKFIDFVPYEEKHISAAKGSRERTSHLDRTLAAPNASNILVSEVP